MEKEKYWCWSIARSYIPSIKKIYFSAWLSTSLVIGFLVFFVSLYLLWPPVLGVINAHVLPWAQIAIHKIAPSYFSSEVAQYELFVESWRATGALAVLYRDLIAALVISFLPGILLAPHYLIAKDGLIYLRGPQRYIGRRAIAKLNRRFKKENHRRPDHEIAPGIPYPASKWTQHLIIAGGVGSGKSTFIKPLVKKIITANERLIMFDPKGDFTKAFSTPSIFGPWDSRSCSWDIGRDMRNVGDMRRFAASMIKEATDPMWSSAARQILVGLMMYLRKTRGQLWGWRELADLLSSSLGLLHELMQRYHPEAVRAVEKFSVTTHGILINLASYCSAIYDLADAWGEVPESRRISFVEWTLSNPIKHRQIILQGHGAYPEITQAYVQGFLGVVSALISSIEMDDDPDRKIWIGSDEAAEMGKAPIRQIFSMGRGRGVRGFIACQDLVQLEDIYGKNFVKALLSMSGTLLVGKTGPGDTADMIAKAIGSREVERKNIAFTRSAGANQGSSTLSYHREDIALYKPSELGSRLGAEIKEGGVIMALVTEGDAYELFFPFEDFPDRRPAHVASPWTQPKSNPAVHSLDVEFPVTAPLTARAIELEDTKALAEGIALPSSEEMSSLDKILIGAGYGEE
jgi:hypothetical protein